MQQQAVADVESANVLTDVFIGVTAATGAAAITTLIIFLVNEPPTEEPTATGKATGHSVDWSLAPLVDSTGGGAQFSVRF